MPFNPHTRALRELKLLSLALNQYQDASANFINSSQYKWMQYSRFVVPALGVVTMITMVFAQHGIADFIDAAVHTAVGIVVAMIWNYFITKRSADMGTIYKEADDSVNGDLYAVADVNVERVVEITNLLHHNRGEIEGWMMSSTIMAAIQSIFCGHLGVTLISCIISIISRILM